MDLTPFKNCLAHTNGLYISNELDSYKPCCWFKDGIAASSVEEYNTKLVQMDIAVNCAHCIKQEEAGSNWSHRKLFVDTEELVLGVCFDNICNLKCVTCSPLHSTRLIPEWIKLARIGINQKSFHLNIKDKAGEKLAVVKEFLMINTNANSIRVEIFGGEPLINPLVHSFIEWMSEQPFNTHVKLSLTTNGTGYFEKLEYYLTKFSEVNVQLSVDGVGSIFEYLRFGANADKLMEFAQRYKIVREQNPNFMLSFNYTLSWMNSLHFAEYFNWICTNFIDVGLYLTKLEGPEVFSVNILSDKMRKEIHSLVLSRINAPSPSWQHNNLLELYTQSMLFAFDKETFDVVNYNNALIILQQTDKFRNTSSKELITPVQEIINRHQ